jgi:hypothetical protein
MDLFQLMTGGEDDLKAKALERLEAIVRQYLSGDDGQQDEALSRAINFCGMEWGSYRAGLEALAARVEGRGGQQSWASELRDEAGKAGTLIERARAARTIDTWTTPQRAQVVARYGSRGAACGLTHLEQAFLSLAGIEEGQEWEPALDGWTPLDPTVPERLRAMLSTGFPLPHSIIDARAEFMAWEDRKTERVILFDEGNRRDLPTVCRARQMMVVELWRSVLPAQSTADLDARLDYWQSWSGGDVAGYDVIRADIARVVAQGGLRTGGESTKDKCRRLKADNPGWSLAMIGRELGISRQAVHKHLK